jgi:O-antigen/teichoic acid export membrane protein
VRFIARYRVEGDGARLRGLLRFGRTLVLAAGAVLAILGIPLAPLVVSDATYVGTLQLAFVAIPILALLNLDAAYARGFDWMAMSAVAGADSPPVILLLLAAAACRLDVGRVPRTLQPACAYLLASLAHITS